MASPQFITRDNYSSLLVRSTNPRGSVPDGNVYFDTANDRIQLITLSELATVDLGSGLEANPLTSTTKIQALALYKFILEQVQADSTLQRFRRSMDTVPNEMARLVGATSFLSGIKLADGAVDINGAGGELGDDRLKIGGSGTTEFAINGSIDRIYHGAQSQNDINSTTQCYYLLAASLSEADRQAATPVNFSKLGSIDEMIQTQGSTANGDTGAGDFDSTGQTLILCAREFGYTNGEANSIGAKVSKLGAYSQGYGIGNSVVTEINALSFADVWTTPIAPYNALSFFRYATPQTRSGFSTSGAGASGDFTDEVQLSSGTMDITQLRAWLDALMLQDTDENANTGVTGAFRPKRAEPLYTIAVTGELQTRAGIYVDPAKLTAEAQQQIILTNDSGGLHKIPFNSGLSASLSTFWLSDSAPWGRIMYVDAAGANDFNTAAAITALDASATALFFEGTRVAALANADVNTVTWQSGNTVRYTLNGAPNLSALTLPCYVRFSGSANSSNDGAFWVTNFDDTGDWIEVDNPLRVDATDDEAADSSCVMDFATNFDSRISSATSEFIASYAYDTETAGGNVAAGQNQAMVLQLGGIDESKTSTIFFTISRTANIPINAETEQETN